MAELLIHVDRVVDNIEKLNVLMRKHGAQWTLISKVLSGHRESLRRILDHPATAALHSIGDSRLSSLKTIKELRPDITTMYIKPVPQNLVPSIVRHADISLISSLATLRLLNAAAAAEGRRHGVIVMVEMGELREGVVRENIVDFYREAFAMEHIEVHGIGTNLGCMHGVEPTYDKMIQLSLYRALLEQMFDRTLPLISGGSSITLPLLGSRRIPHSINHYRIGEAVFLGTSPLDNTRFRNLSTNIFEYRANILELEEKERTPDGVINDAAIGHVADVPAHADAGDTHCRAIVDFGLLDVDVHEITPKDNNIRFAGTTSDVTVFEIGDNQRPDGQQRYHVGDTLRFTPSYMGCARLMSSKFIAKTLADGTPATSRT
ncbi:MAG: alanine racemase [Bacteroidota bacterium]|nr:alanine racemase [Bacteroidota bacterium]